MSRYPTCVSSRFRVISLTNKQKILEATQLQLNDVCQDSEFTTIDTIIDCLEASMPPPERIPRFDRHRLAVGYNIINVAILSQHFTPEASHFDE